MKQVFIFAVLMLCVAGMNAQTFQYSRGWTNGKRSSLGVTDKTDIPALRQMMPMVQVLTANDLNNKERLIQQIIKTPCELRMALMNRKFKPNDDYMATAADASDEDINRFKRELSSH